MILSADGIGATATHTPESATPKGGRRMVCAMCGTAQCMYTRVSLCIHTYLYTYIGIKVYLPSLSHQYMYEFMCVHIHKYACIYLHTIFIDVCMFCVLIYVCPLSDAFSFSLAEDLALFLFFRFACSFGALLNVCLHMSLCASACPLSDAFSFSHAQDLALFLCFFRACSFILLSAQLLSLSVCLLLLTLAFPPSLPLCLHVHTQSNSCLPI